MDPQVDRLHRRATEEEDRPVAEGVDPTEAAVVPAAPADVNAPTVDPTNPILQSGGEDASPAGCSKASDCNSCFKLHQVALEKEQLAAGSEITPSLDTGCYWKPPIDQDSSVTSGCLERFGLPPDMLKEVNADETTCFFHIEATTIQSKVVNGEIDDDDLGGNIVSGAFILLFIACLFVLRHRILGLIQGKLMSDDSQHGVEESHRSTTDVLAGLNFGSSHGPINGSSPSHQQFARESVPLAAADMNNRSISIEDEEWGWEDSDPTDELEMAISASRTSTPSRSVTNAASTAEQRRQKEEDDLQMALALSMSESAVPTSSTSGGPSRVSLPPKSKLPPSPQQAPKPKATPPMRRQTSNQSNGSRSGAAPQPIDTQSSILSVPMTTSDILQSMPMAITSLGTKSSNANAKKPAPKPKPNKDDELFASLGLTSKPTFKPVGTGAGSVPSAPRSGGYTTSNNIMPGTSGANGAGPSQSTTSSAPRSAPSRHVAATTNSTAKAVMDEEDGLSSGLGDDWGDDDDLDDLLND